MERGTQSERRKRVVVFGASGTIGQAVLSELNAQGYEALGVLRPSETNERLSEVLTSQGIETVFGDVLDPNFLRDAVFDGGRIDAVISCLASRTGAPDEAKAIDFQANLDILDSAEAAGVKSFVLLSAICVQKPRLAFQHAKLRFERRLQVSGLTWSIVRPTAFFKSLSGQVERVKAGKPYLLFGDGELTRCKPISDADLARYIVSCLTDQTKHKRILPIGGPGPAISLKDQGEVLFSLSGKPPRFRQLPVALFSTVAMLLKPLSFISGWAREKAEYARIAQYYATESMLVWDKEAQAYSSNKTPEFGSDTLRDHYRALLND